jgi:protein O-mannosyl-transferase
LSRSLFGRLRRDPGLALLLTALVMAIVIYAPTLGRGLVNFDDPWLVGDNWVLQDASWSSLQTIFFDLHSPRRFVLTPEYLPVRDLSVMLDFAIWSDWYAGFHLTNLLLYLAAITVWFFALDGFGIDRKIAGLCVLVWAVHPSHAESVAWISERKGLLSMMFAGVCVLAFARFRSGRDARWLVLATLTAVCAVWSKAPGAFAIASLAGLEVALPARRTSWRRSLIGLGTIAVVAGIAFIPVLQLAGSASVVGTDGHAPAGRLAMVFGVHGFYLRSAAMTLENAVSYPISTHGPTVIELVLGAVGLLALLALAVLPRIGSWKQPPEVRAGALIWIIGWLPIGHAILPLQMVLVADRYLLFPTLGLTLLLAYALTRIPRVAARRALIATIVVAGSLRAFDAQSGWQDPLTLWDRATASNPDDGSAWAMYVEAMVADARNGGDPERVKAVLEAGLRHTRSPRLVHRQALIVLPDDRPRGIALMREAAQGGEAIAMSNLALLLLEERQTTEALQWARAGATARPNAHALRTLGKIALAAANRDEALEAFEHAYALEPASCANRINLGLALVAVHRADEVQPYLDTCLTDPRYSANAKALLRDAQRQLETPATP